MPLRPVKDIGIRTARDEARRQDRERLAVEWARVDRDIAEAPSEPLLSRVQPEE